ncbi:MAG: MerR family transcriptional regulator [Actinomycetales bacterium]|nr:MerR family transcriptional regulator [Actinomycetales bacterium]
MRISELAARTGVPLATLKFYLREGLLPHGLAVAATRAEYDESHVQRVAVIRALTETAGLPLQRVGEVLRLIDDPGPDLFATLGRAVGQLPPPIAELPADADAETAYPRARAVLEQLGQVWDPHYAAVAQLERALEAAEAAGLPMTPERARSYGAAIRAIAEFDVGAIPTDSSGAVGYAVLGTALYEPVIAAMRRLAHQDVAARRLGIEPAHGPETSQAG